MASGQTLVTFEPTAYFPPASNYATPATRNTHPILQFDASTEEAAYFAGTLPRHYAGGGITVRIAWMATSATASTCTWKIAMEAHNTSTDLDADSFASTVTGSAVTTNGTAGVPTYTDIALTSGAQMDSLAAGEHFRLKVSRATGGMSGDAELLGIEIRET